MRIESLKLENFFIFFMFTFGIIIVFLIPPMASPDENTHFYNSYALAEFDFFPTFGIKNQEDTVNLELGRIQPKELVDFVEYYNSKFAGKLYEKYTFESMYLDGWGTGISKEKVFHTYWNVDVNVFAYLFSSIGILIFKVISYIFNFGNISPYNLLIAGRISNLFFYTIIIFHSIKMTPYYKKTMFLLAIMPMNLFLAASITYDTVIITMSFLLFAFVLKLLRSKKSINWCDILIIMIITIFFCITKQVYATLLLVLFAVPMDRFKSKKFYITTISFISIVGIIAFGSYQLILNRVLNDYVSIWRDIQEQQITVILSHPIKFIAIIINSFMNFYDFYLVSFLGNLGQLDTNLPQIILIFFSIILLFTAIVEAGEIEELQIRRNMKIFAMLGVFGAIYGCFAGIYIIWTGMMKGVGCDFVDGFQGRYFIPLFLYLILVISNNKFKKWILWSKINDLVYIFSLWIGSVNILIVQLILLLRYWI